MLRKMTEKLLRSREVFDIDAFGWLNENDVDPEFIGYVMWTQSPPCDFDFTARQNNKPPGRAPTESDQKLMELGHDFFGLMKTARHFIGLALFHQPAVPSIRVEPTVFDFNEFAALVALTSAAERLSDFIVVTTLGTKTGEKGERNEAYVRLRESGLSIEQHEFVEGFRGISKARKARNKAAHGLATQPARAHRRLLVEDREAFEKKRWPVPVDLEMPFEDAVRGFEHFDAEERSAVEARAKLLCDCYIKLVKMGELSFRTEHHWRALQKS